MALREVGAKLTLEGEAEWNRQMKAVDRELKNLKSELAASSAEFNGQANTVEALRAKQEILQKEYSQQTAKIHALRDAVDSAKVSWGENSEQVDKATQSLNYALAAQARIGNEISETNEYLKEAESAADGCATSIDGYGKKVKAAEGPTRKAADAADELADAERDAAGGAGGLLDALQQIVPQLNSVKTLSSLTAAGLVSGIGAAFKKTWDWAMGLVESTADLRKELTELEISCEAAGAALDGDMHSAMKIVYEATGDMGSAFKTVSTLLQADYSGSGMVAALDELRGAVIAFPETLKIDSLAEGLQKTLSTGTAAGQFKDMLERLGTDVDDFQENLGDCTTAAERQQVVLDTLASSGLREMTKEYRDASEASVALSDAQYELEMANARLGESFEPVAARLKETKANFAEFLANLLDAHALGGNFVSALIAGVSSGAAAGDEKGLSMEEIYETLEKAGESFETIFGSAERAGVSVGEFINQLHADQVREAAEAAEALAAQEEAEAEAAAAAAAAHKEAMENLGETNDAVQDAVGRLAELQAQYESIRAGIDGVASGFTNLKEATKQYETSVGDMVEALQSQIDYMAQYRENLAAAKDLGLSDALIEEFSDGSAQSAAYLQAIVADGGSSIEELNAKFAEVEEGKQVFVDTVAEMLPGFTETIDEITATLDDAVDDWNRYAEAYNAGEGTIDGLLAGLDRYDDVFDMGVSMAEAFNAGYKSAQDQHSPSRRARRMMGDTVEGLLLGGQDRMQEISSMGADMGDSLWRGFDRAAELTAAPVVIRQPGGRDVLADGARAEVVNNFYVQEMDEAQIDYFIQRVNREIGASL